MSFANPYNFLGIDEDDIEREKDFLTPKSDTYSGQMRCIIWFKSNFITAGVNTDREKRQLRINNRKIGIQGSSLKGLLRSTAEAISNSCISMMSAKYKYRFMTGMPAGTSSSSGVEYEKIREKDKDLLVFNHKSLVNTNALIDSCDDKKGLCICCQLFGTTAKENKETGKSFSYKGKIRISDALYLGIRNEKGEIDRNVNPVITKHLKRHALSNPKNHHEAFYLNGNKIKGRKFYYHQEDDKLLDERQSDTILVELIRKDSIFEFTISFENLTAEEYGLLLTTLELEPGLGHKIGMGKPLGLGSCVIEVTEIKEYSKNRYLDINVAAQVFNEKNGNLKARKDEIKGYWNKGIPKDLRCILKLTPEFTEIRYPKKDIHNPAKDEFKVYKRLHDPCREFSDDDKKGSTPAFQFKPKSPERPDKPQPKSNGIMAEAFRKVKKKKR